MANALGRGGGLRVAAAGAPMKTAILLLALLLAGCNSPTAQTPDSHTESTTPPATVSTTGTSSAGPVSTASQTSSQAPSQAPVAVPAGGPKITVLERDPYYEFSIEGPAANWTFGDGATAQGNLVRHTYVSKGHYAVEANLDDKAIASTQVSTKGGFGPHVVVAISDAGINPYHDAYARPDLTENPCTYIPNYPCLPALELTLDAPTYDAAFAADKAKWDAIKVGDTFWIPGTSIIGAVCHAPYTASPADDPTSAASSGTPICILGENANHGTGTTTAVLRENPEALLVFQESGNNLDGIQTAGLPFDVSSLSYGSIVPIPVGVLAQPESPFSFRSAGNDGRSSFTDWQKGHPSQITVGGAGPYMTSIGYTTDVESGRFVDVAAPFCRNLPDIQTLDGRYDYCGTSFSAPTSAGALSLTILRLRQAAGYSGLVANGFVDGIHSIKEVRDAMNRTASYDPAIVDGDIIVWVPVAENAPWASWGWGYFGRVEAEIAALHLLGASQPAKDATAVQFMAAQDQLRAAATAPGTAVCEAAFGGDCA